MRLSNKQKALLHMIPAGLGIDEAQRRIIQRNVGGFYSAADRAVTRWGFQRVMGYYEDRAGGKLDGFSAGYWSGQAAAAGPEDGLLWRVCEEARQLDWSVDDANRFMASTHMSSGRFQRVAEADTYWLTRMVQALIEMNNRRRKVTA
ncbi:MAG TPA: hypothetical protein VNA25_09510 [Phycisphaerae bacterium]|nr:hypothetical protein [Phycisphaerae bacterium]